MSTLRNKVVLIGHLGNAPEIINTENGNKLAKFSMATNETYLDKKGEKVETTQWHYIVAWNGAATIAERFLNKGKEVAIEGKLNSRSYEDKEGNQRYITEIIANEIVLLGKN